MSLVTLNANVVLSPLRLLPVILLLVVAGVSGCERSETGEVLRLERSSHQKAHPHHRAIPTLPALKLPGLQIRLCLASRTWTKS